MALQRNTLIILLSIACIVVAALGWRLYEETRQPSGVQINVGPQGVEIKENSSR